ncbi:putative ribonuclease H-like domain-containing protein [Tanacetum coccineum]
MELENTQNNALAKLPMLKLGEYEMWEIRIKQYFQIQDYALWEVIENGNSWVPIPVTATETGPSTGLKMTVPSTAEEKICKKNDVKARSLLLMALPNEHQLTFDQYVDAQSMFAAIKARFGGNEATKKTQKALLKQQYENFNASSSESLDSIFNRLQKLVSRLAILGVVTPPEDLNVKFLRSLLSEWDIHVVVWMNKPDFDTMGLDDLYNNFKIVEQKVKRSAGAINDDKNLAFLTASGASSTNNINTVNPEVSTGTTKVNTASTKISTASFSDATVYAFLSTQPQGSQLVHEDLEQLHDDDLKEMDLKWNMALLSMRARKFYQRTGRKIIIDGSSTAGYDKSKVECFNCHKMGHFARECRAPRSKNNKNWNQGSSSKAVRIEDASEKAMCAIDGAGFDWSDMAEEEIQANMALIAFSDYKEIALLKRSVGHKEYLMGLLRTELEMVKEEKEGFEFKISKFEKSAKDLDQLLASQITDKSKKGFGYNVIPSPHPLILNRPTPLDLSYSGLEEFKQPEVNEYGHRDSSLKPATGCDKESDNSKENTDDSLKQQQKTDSNTSSVKEEEPKKARENNDAPIIEDWVSDDEDEVEPIPKVEKKTVIPTATKKEFVKPEKPVRRSVRYAEMYRSQRPRGNQRNWNGQKSNQLGCNFVFNNKACFIYGSFDHIQYSCPKTSHPSAYKYMAPKAVLMKTGLKSVNTARPVNTVRSVNTGRPFSTARSFNTVRPSYTAHPKSTVHCARPRTYFQNQAQSTVHRPFYKRTALTKRSYYQNVNTGRQRFNTGRQNVNTVRARGFNAVKPSACWVWRPIKPNGASLSNSQLNDKGFVDSGCSRHMTGNIAHLSDFKDFDGGYVTFGGGAYGGRITGKGTIKTDNLDFDDVYFVKELKFNLFSVSQMCDKKNYVLFTDSECLVLSPNFKLPDENQILLKIPRQDNMYSFDMKNIVPKDSLTCLVAKATSEESMLWHRRLGHINFKNINKLVKENLVRDLPLKRFENDQTCVACLKGKQHRASCKTKAFNPITKPLFMLHMDLFGPTFVSSLMHKKYCLVVTDDYSRFSWVFFLTTKDETSEILKNNLSKREKGIKREYSVARTPQQNGVAERKNRTLIEAARTMLADSKLPTTFGRSCFYCLLCIQGVSESSTSSQQDQDWIAMPIWKDASYFGDASPNIVDDAQIEDKDELHDEDDATEESHDEVNTGSKEVSTALPEVNTATPEDLVGPSPASEDSHMEDQEIELGNIPQSYEVPTTPHIRIHKDHPIEHVIGDVQSSVQTRRMKTSYSEKGFLSVIYEGKSHQDLHTCLFVCFLSQDEPKRISQALRDPAWVEAMQEELLQFKLQKVWILVDLPKGHRIIGTKWVYRNKKVERGIVIRNKARLVAQGHTQEEGIDYDEVFALVARIEAIKIFQAYASYMGFIVYQMDAKSAFLYGQIEEEVYVCEPPGFEDPHHPNKVYKVVKALYGLHQAPRAWYDTLANYILCNGFERGKIDQTLFIKRHKGHILLVQIYVDDIIFGSTKKELCDEFEKLMNDKFQMILSETHLLCGFTGKRSSRSLYFKGDSPLELVAYTDSDYAGATLDRKSTTGGCQFLGNRLISWQCKKQTVVATSTTEAEYVAAASCCGQVLWIQNQLLDYGYNFMDTVIYIDNTSTICIIENPVQHSKTKHIEIRHHFIRDCNAKKLIQMAKIDTQHNVADLLTKGFDAGRFQYLVSSIGMLNP